jgi:serine/threonine protein kinase
VKAGDRLASGRFHLLEELGKGGMGRVFSAYDEEKGAEVALKIVGRMTPQSIVQLKREFRTASELLHPNIVRLHELFRDGWEWFFTMQLVRGAVLPDLLERNPLPEARADLIRRVAQQLAAALHAVHGIGAVHGDLKPSNFLIETASGVPRVVLLDFGLAQPFGVSEGGGTFAYMAPEQLLGEAVSESTDWYSLGVVLHEALTGELPRAGMPANLGHAPADLRMLCNALLRPQPDQRPLGTAILGMLGVSESAERSSYPVLGRSRLIGRRVELARFQEIRHAASPSSPSVVFVHGPAGIGKTTFVEHCVEVERTRGAIVLRGRCRENESIGYNAIDGIVDDLVTVLAEMDESETKRVLPRSVSDLVQLFPALRASSAMAAIAFDDPDRADQGLVRQRATVAFAELLRNLGDFGDVVVWIDDLQWSDADSALILGPLLGGVESGPVFFIGSYRSDGTERIAVIDALYTERALNMPAANYVPLGLLGEAESEQMALELLPSDTPDAREKARDIRRDAAGLPLFITELVHTARCAPAPSSPKVVTLSSVVGQRVSSLSRSSRRLLELVAVAAGPVSRATLKQAQGVPSSELEEAITLLRATRLVVTNGLRDEHTVDIRHDRLRELVFRDIDEEACKGYHMSLGVALELRGGRPEDIATHYQGAGEPSRAARYWLAAADDSAKALAFHRAAEFYSRALKRAHLDPDDRRHVMLRRAEMLAYAGESGLAADQYLTIAQDCPRDQAIELRRRAAEQLLLSGRIQAGMRVIEEVLVATRMRRSRSGRKAIPSFLVGRLRLRLRGLRYNLRSETELSREELARLDVAWTLTCALGFVDYIRGADFQNRHLLLALRAGEPRRLARALALEALNAAAPAPGSQRRTEDLLRASEGLVCETADRDTAMGLLSLARGVTAYLQSDTDQAVTHCSHAVETLATRCAGAVWERVTAQRFLIASLFYSGQLSRLSKTVAPLLAEAEGTANLYASQFFRSGYSTVAWLVRDEVAEARRHLVLAREEWCSETFQLPEYNRLLGETYLRLYAGEPEEAAARLSENWRAIEEAQLLRIAIVKVQLWQLRAAAAVAAAASASLRGDKSAAIRFRADARRCTNGLRRDRLGWAPPPPALSAAASDAAEGAREIAGQKLEQAAVAFEAQGMHLFGAAAQFRLGHLRGGEPGRALVERSTERFVIQGVCAPSKMIGMLAPGFVES